VVSLLANSLYTSSHWCCTDGSQVPENCGNGGSRPLDGEVVEWWGVGPGVPDGVARLTPIFNLNLCSSVSHLFSRLYKVELVMFHFLRVANLP
jgi:hypothetical protein